MKTTITKTARAAAATTLVALLGVGLSACYDDTDPAAGASASTATDRAEAPRSTSESSSDIPFTAASETMSDSTSGEDVDPAVDEVDGKQLVPDDVERVEFSRGDVVFDDSGSASSDGTYFNVTTPAEEQFSVKLPSEADGWIWDVVVDLGDAGFGYLVTQSAGEFYETNLVVLDQGRLYVVKQSDEVPFGDSFEGGETAQGYETFTTGQGRHLVTVLDDGPDYEWSVVDDTLVPTPIEGTS